MQQKMFIQMSRGIAIDFKASYYLLLKEIMILTIFSLSTRNQQINFKVSYACIYHTHLCVSLKNIPSLVFATFLIFTHDFLFLCIWSEDSFLSVQFVLKCSNSNNSSNKNSIISDFDYCNSSNINFS